LWKMPKMAELKDANGQILIWLHMITLNLLLKINLKIFLKGLPYHIFLGPQLNLLLEGKEEPLVVAHCEHN